MPNTRYIATLQRIKEYSNIRHYDAALAKVTTEGSTLGKFSVIDTQENKELFKCYSLENAGPSTDKNSTDKRIMPRDYRVKWAFTGTSQGLAKGGNFRAGKGTSIEEARWFFEKYKDIIDEKLHFRFFEWNMRSLGLLLWLESMPSFELRCIFIHNGNYPQDTKGCILLGYNADNKGIITNSSRCIEDFNNLVLKIGAENLTLRIKEIS